MNRQKKMFFNQGLYIWILVMTSFRFSLVYTLVYRTWFSFFLCPIGPVFVFFLNCFWILHTLGKVRIISNVKPHGCLQSGVAFTQILCAPFYMALYGKNLYSCNCIHTPYIGIVYTACKVLWYTNRAFIVHLHYFYKIVGRNGCIIFKLIKIHGIGYFSMYLHLHFPFWTTIINFHYFIYQKHYWKAVSILAHDDCSIMRV